MKATCNPIKCLFLLSTAALGTADAHISYNSRDFGTFNPGYETAGSTKSGTVSSTFGWAYSTDENLGDSHRNRAFRFTLLNPGQVVISVQRTGVDNILLPAFSVYSGLAHLPPAELDHDGSPITEQYLSGIFGDPNIAQGAFNAVGDWKIGSDAGIPDSFGNYNYDELSAFTYMGNAADGTSTNYGTAAGINGDGLADGFVTGTFNLAAGDYTLMVGGGQYLTSPPNGPYTSYGVGVTLSVIPEPSGALLLGISCMGLALRRRR